MAQRQFRTDDTSAWTDRFGSGADGSGTISSSISDSSRSGFANTTISVSTNATAATVASGSGFANGDLILIHQSRNGGDGAGNWELNKISSGGGTTSWTLAYNTTHAYDTTAQAYRLAQYTNFTVNSSQSLTGTNWDGSKGGIVAILANNQITVTGNIVVNGGNGSSVTTNTTGGATTGGYRGGDARYTGSSSDTGYQGEGTLASKNTQSTSANGNGGGGAAYTSSGNPAGGGGGGGGTAGSSGSAAPGATGGSGGSTAGAASLITMVFGGGGGGGAGDTGLITSVGGGGSGGGIVILIAPTITVSGSITTNGGNGGDGHVQADGAGGGGGSILLKAQNATLGSSLVTGTGGTSSSGGGGGVGRIHIDYSSAFTGTTSPTIDSSLDTIFANAVVGDDTGYFYFM